MKRNILTALALMLIVIAIGSRIEARVMIPDPGQPDSIMVDSVYAVLPNQAIIPVNFYNDQDLTAIEVTLRHNSTFLKIDSFSFVGGRVEQIGLKGFVEDDTSITIFAFQADEAPISPGTGLLGHLYLSYPGGTPAHLVMVDSTTTFVNLVERGNYFSTGETSTFKPQFKYGYVDIMQTCCRGSVGNVGYEDNNLVDIGDLTQLIVYLFIDLTIKLKCESEANIDGSLDGVVDIGDLTALISYLFITRGNPPLPLCQ